MTNISSAVKTRFAPSPTGYIHLGNLRAAFFSVLFARRHQGLFLLRIEDTDLDRSQTLYVDALIEDLAFLGIKNDEGPFFQSERHAVYEQYYQALQSQDLAYPCYCSETELDIQRKVMLSSGQAPRYAGTCAKLTAEARAAKEASGLKPVLRFRMPKGLLTFEDGVQGLKQFDGGDIGDFVIRRADGTSTFLYCNAIDDSLMGVTHVLRGEDHLTNTPRQLAVLRALGLQEPTYAHLPMIVGSDGKPLSKRNGSEAIRTLREIGYFKEALLNYLARLGHPFAENTCYTLDELGGMFDLTKLSRSPSQFDLEQLNYWQKHVLLTKSLSDLRIWLQDTLGDVTASWSDAFLNTVRGNIVFPKDAAFWYAQCYDAPNWTEEALAALKGASDAYYEAIVAACDADSDYETLVAALKQTGVSGKALFMPLRLLLTGELSGPDVKAVWGLLGASSVREKLSALKNQR